MTYTVLASPAPLTSAESSKTPDLASLYREHGTFVWRALRRLGVAESDVEDLVQDTFLAAHRSLPGFQGRSSMRTWMFGIAFHCASEHRRKRQREVTSDALDEVAVNPEQLAKLDREDLRRMLDLALDTLRPEARAVFVFYELEELAMAEVAAIVGCPLQTAYSRLHEARRGVELAVARLTRNREP